MCAASHREGAPLPVDSIVSLAAIAPSPAFSPRQTYTNQHHAKNIATSPSNMVVHQTNGNGNGGS